MNSWKTKKVFLEGNPPYALMVGNKPWDLNSFRPNPVNYMKNKKTYSAKVLQKVENISSGEEVYIPWKVKIDLKNNENSIVFINVR
jgi:hypothetical protein